MTLATNKAHKPNVTVARWKALGLCLDCGAPRHVGERRYMRCEACLNKPYRRYVRKLQPVPSQYAGTVTCLACDRLFQSWDRRKNRVCPHCKYLQEGAAGIAPNFLYAT